MGKKINTKLNKLTVYIQAQIPRPEDVLFVVLVVFCAIYGLLLYGIGENIKNEVSFAPLIKTVSAFEKNVTKMVSDKPIKEMVSFISQRDSKTASFLVAIAKKESNWGKFSPKKDGKECYNYWGYRGTYNQTKSGYSCFDSPEQAVEVVGNRIDELVNQNIDTPQEMIVWKCGRSCSQHNPYDVKKWIQDVDLYVNKLKLK
jgi:hypothetical protein